MNNNSKQIKKIAAAAICLALCMVLPFLTGQIPQFGAMLSPMHIPVLLAGFIAGPFLAAIVGFIAPLLRFALFGMPPIMPTGVSMAFELAAYGLSAGILYNLLPKKKLAGYVSVYVALIAAMVIGRIVWGLTRLALFGLVGTPFTLEMFMAGAFINALPGIILHIILIPIVVIALKKAKLIE